MDHASDSIDRLDTGSRAIHRDDPGLGKRRLIVQLRFAAVVVAHWNGDDVGLIVAISYKLQIVYVKFIGTHKKYDAIDAETVELA